MRWMAAHEVTIRAGGAGDLDAVLDLWAHARSAAAVTADTQEGLLRLIQRDAGALLVACAEERVVGALIGRGTAGAATCTDSPCSPSTAGTGSSAGS